MPLPLKQELELLGMPRLIEAICDQDRQLRQLQAELIALRLSVTPSAPAATSAPREIVATLGHGWQIERTPVLECPPDRPSRP